MQALALALAPDPPPPTTWTFERSSSSSPGTFTTFVTLSECTVLNPMKPHGIAGMSSKIMSSAC